MNKNRQGVRDLLLLTALALPLAGWSGISSAAEDNGGPEYGRAERGGPGGPGGPGRASPAGPGAEQCGPDGAGPEHGPQDGPPPGEHGPRGPQGPHDVMGVFGRGPELPFLRGIELTEAQQDKLFAILHAQAPFLREQGKAADKAHAALRALNKAAAYDDAKAAALANSAAQAMASIALQQVRTQQKVLALLTPEQRKQLAEDKPHRPVRP
ncbi:Spy/CpxP family protein refolding chaperone [Oxalobacteraceae bacterium]|nr:Spy/CpxP family protein refolding chaperone [Oxalobacteraceae bacterium]